MIDQAIIIPIYNEEAIITSVINEWYTTLQSLKIKFEIHVYNDGSTDNSLILLKKLEEDYNN